ncbi:MAG: hypothetical protein ISQ32_00010 [Rickettsiales bacterium]|nr:hypothetical protein [Rickettsiales bacterium]
MNLLKITNIVILILVTASCSFSPYTIHLPQEGSYQLVQGVRDGCDTAHSSRGNSFYRTFYKFKQDPTLIEDDEYYHSWYRGYIYCFHIVNRRAFKAIDSDLSPPWQNFWGSGRPKIEFPYPDGVPTPWSNEGIKLFGESESSGGGVWWNNMFKGCKTVFC